VERGRRIATNASGVVDGLFHENSLLMIESVR